METTSDVTPAGWGLSPTTRSARVSELPQEGWGQVRTVRGVWPTGRPAVGEIGPPSERRSENPE